jgi:hypothetical protein
MPLFNVTALSLALVTAFACNGEKSPEHVATTVSTASPLSAVRTDGAYAAAPSVAMGNGIADRAFARRAAMDEKAMVVQSAPAAPAMPQSRATNLAGSDAQRGDFTGGVPLPAIDATGAMLVRHGQASIQVKGVDAAVNAVRQTAAQFGGFVANTSLRSGKDEQRSATLELRVPSDKFDGLLSALSNLGKVESVTANAEDVAEEYVDLGARAANARKVEARLVEMLATRTGKLSDVLTVEQELARVRMEAERYDARLRWLERRASLSSLDITIHEPVPLLDTPRGPGPIAEALAEAWTRMIAVIAWSIASLGLLIPLALLFGLAALLARRVLRGGVAGGSGEAAR